MLDSYDTTRNDPAYSAYKYDVLKEPLQQLLESPDLKLTHGRIVSRKWLAKELGVDVDALKFTPRLKELVERRQSAIDHELRRGTTKSAFQIGRTTHLNLGATPYSVGHERVFDFSDLVPHYGLEFAEKIGTVFVAVARNQATAKVYYSRIKHFLMWITRQSTARIVEYLKAGERIGQAEFERAALVYKQHVIYGTGRESKKRTRSHGGFIVIEKFGEAGVFPRMKFPKERTTRRGRRSSPRPSLAEAPDVECSTKNIIELTKEEATCRGIKLDHGRDAIVFLITTQAKRNLSSRSGIGGVLSAT